MTIRNIAFRWLVLCDKYGKKTEPSLEVKIDNEDGEGVWEDVDYVEMKEWEYYGTERKDIKKGG